MPGNQDGASPPRRPCGASPAVFPACYHHRVPGPFPFGGRKSGGAVPRNAGEKGVRSFKQMRWLFADLLIAAALSASCVLVGLRALEDWRGPALSISNELYIPGVMFASGRGFVNVPPETVPGLPEFLAFDRQEFSLPSETPLPGTVPLDAYQEYHRYLVFAAGMVWRVFGVSWGGMKGLILALFSVSAVMVYGVFRLATGRLAGAAGAALFVFSPLMPHVLFNVRDFSKVPFFLAVFLACGLLLRKPPNARMLRRCAALAGLSIGVGLGFRRDLLVCLPPVAVVLLACRTAGAGTSARLGAVAVLLAVFSAVSFPVLTAFQRHGTLGAHDLLMGMSTASDDGAGLVQASHERLPAQHDFYVYMATAGHVLRNRPGLAEDKWKGRYYLDLVSAFPGDMVARAYSATAAILGGVMTYTALLNHLDIFLFAAVGAVMLMAARDARTAAVFVFLLLYFCGITSLQFHYRHVIHLSFLPFWSVAVLFSAVPRWWASRKSREEASAGGGEASPAARALAFAAVLFLLLWAPLAAARLAQRATLAGMADTYRRAEWVPAPMEKVWRDGQVVYLPSAESACVQAFPAGEGLSAALGFLMVEFDGPLPDSCATVLYENEKGEAHGSHRVALCAGDCAGVFRYYFPVYAVSGAGVGMRFSGFAVSGQSAAHIRGVYQAADANLPGTLVTLCLPVEGPPRRGCQTLRLPGQDGPGYPCQSPS